jgi:hypothetical protein
MRDEGGTILAGPRNGAAENAAMGTPRSSFLHKSARVPPTSVMGAENAMPSMARQTSRVAIFLASASGIMNTTATSKVVALTPVSDHVLTIGDSELGATH